MKWINFLLLIVLLLSACSTQIAPVATNIPDPTLTLQIIPTNKPTLLPNPTLQGFPQITLGLPYAAINNNGCGGYAIYTMDYDTSESILKNYWDNFPEIPKPTGLKFRTKDGRRALDFCTKIGYPITWQLEEGLVTQNRDEGVLDVLITKGIGKGLTLTHGHVNPDIDPSKPGIQKLAIGTIVHLGDLIAFTGRGGIPIGSDASTQTGLLDSRGYIPEQELMLIGEDGQPNIIYSK